MLATYVPQMETQFEDFVEQHIRGHEGNPIVMFPKIRRCIMEMPLKLILGIGHEAQALVSHSRLNYACYESEIAANS